MKLLLAIVLLILVLASFFARYKWRNGSPARKMPANATTPVGISENIHEAVVRGGWFVARNG
jgi:hypothetical protein